MSSTYAGCVPRASIPVFTCLLAIFIEGKVPATSEALSLVTLTSGAARINAHCWLLCTLRGGTQCNVSTGVMLSVWEGQASGSSSAIIMCITGTVRVLLLSCAAADDPCSCTSPSGLCR